MTANFRLSINEFDEILLRKIKVLFSENAVIELRIIEDMDETDYLLSTPENAESIMRSIKQLDNNNLVIKKEEELDI